MSARAPIKALQMIRKLLIAVLPSLLVVVLILAGYAVGRYSVLHPMQQPFTHQENAETLGGILADPVISAGLTTRQKTEFFAAYREGPDILDRVDDIAWAVRNTPTPFVGSAPWPGRHDNAVINAYQFRADGEVQQPKSPGHYRIFLTGGSTAFGSGAPTQDSTIASQLEQLLRYRLAPVTGLTYEVATFANPGWASTHERIAIANRLSDLEPDLVISLSGNNDVFWAEAGRNILWFDTQADEFFRGLVDQAYRLRHGFGVPSVSELQSGRVPVETVALRLERNVRLARYALEMAGQEAVYLFALQPTLAVTGKPLTPREQDFLNEAQAYYVDAYAAIRARMQDLSLPRLHFADLSRVFDDLPEMDVFIDSFHFGDKGNAIIAKALFEEVRRIAGALDNWGH